MTTGPTDLDLLRRYEPVVRYTQGELFLPMAADDYLRSATLYCATADRKKPLVIAEPGTLDTATLARLGREHDGEPLYLQYVDKPMSRTEYRAWHRDPARPAFRSSSRFASVGLLSRLIDTTMRLTLLLRGRVPGGYAAAAHRQVGEQDRFVYHGHVTRDGGYIALQYWYLYAMNDWRSTFGGVNDHEADWEQVTIFLVDDEGHGEPQPAWVAFSSHDEVGDDLRRRWDDPDIAFVDETHPVVYAGAGSHSGAYLPGEYTVTVGLPLPRVVNKLRRAVTRIMPWSDPDDSAIGIPYIDYRRGDGPAVGTGQDRSWSPVLIDDATDWVVDYRGLWGLDTHDPLGGERAPAGPRYDRDGTARDSWRQPVAWAGLDKEPPTPTEAAEDLARLRATLQEQQGEAGQRLHSLRQQLRGARVADRVNGRTPRNPSAGLVQLGADVSRMREEQAQRSERLEAIDRAVRRSAVTEHVHAHLRHRAMPVDTDERRGLRERLLRIWAAASASLLLGAAGVLLLLGASNFVGALLLLVVVMVVIEAALRGRLLQLAVNIAVAAVIIVGLWALLAITLGNFRQGVGVLLLLAAGYMGWQTFREGTRT